MLTTYVLYVVSFFFCLINVNMGKFRVKIVPTWFSDTYAILKYSTNGIFWKKLYTYDYDILDEWCYMSPRTFHFSNSESVIKQFKSIEDILRYEKEQELKVIAHNKEISKLNKEIKKSKQDIYKKYGKTF